jgi:hypothetical protein
VDGVVFNPDASAFTISGTSAIDQSVLTFSGAGITNNSGVTQTFVSNSTWIEGMVFHNQATAGAQTTLSIKDSSVSAIGFHDQASAGSATILIPGNGDFGDGNPEVLFYDSATADHSTMIAAGGSGDHGEGAAIIFFDSSTAANAAITVTGATNPTPMVEAFSFLRVAQPRAQVLLPMRAPQSLQVVVERALPKTLPQKMRL